MWYKSYASSLRIGDCTSGFWTSILSAECATVIEEAVWKAREHHLEMVRLHGEK